MIILLERNLVEFKFQGRGGQGVVTLAELFAKAAAYNGKNAQSIPFFGAERRGAAVMAFARVSNDKIWVREPVFKEDMLTIIDDSLFDENKIIDEVRKGGTIIINSRKSFDEARKKLDPLKIATVDATGIAMKTLGRPIVSAIMLGALLKVTGYMSLDSIRRAITTSFGASGIENNMQGVQMVVDTCLVR